MNNIGKISEAEIELNGITVVAGENDTGKSTLNRALYAICNGFYRNDDRIKQEKVESIGEQLRRIPVFRRYGSSLIDVYARDIIEDREKYSDPNALSKMLSHIPEQDQFGAIIPSNEMPEEEWNRVLERIWERLNMTDDSFSQNVMQKYFQSEFHDQILRFGEARGFIRIVSESFQTDVIFEDNIVTNISNPCDIPSQTIYLDNTAVLDSVFNARFLGKPEYGHHFQLMRLLGKMSDNIVDELASRNRLAKTHELISTACGGELIFTKQGHLGYRKKPGSPLVDVRNMSAGIKAFAIIKLLLLNHSLDDDGILLLDEPENNLHPAWQLLFAELLILIQKEFHLRILLNTHSPYLLDAIETFSKKYGIRDNCKFYLALNDDSDAAHFEDVSNHTVDIYDKLAAPFQTLENEECDLP